MVPPVGALERGVRASGHRLGPHRVPRPRGRDLLRDDALEVVVERQHVDGGAVPADRGVAQLAAVRRAAAGLEQGQRVPAGRELRVAGDPLPPVPLPALVVGHHAPAAGRCGDPPAVRSLAGLPGPAGLQGLDLEPGAVEDDGVAPAGVAGDLDPDQAALPGDLGPRVVEPQDLLPAATLLRGVVGAPLGHAAPVAVAAALEGDADRPAIGAVAVGALTRGGVRRGRHRQRSSDGQDKETSGGPRHAGHPHMPLKPAAPPPGAPDQPPERGMAPWRRGA